MTDTFRPEDGYQLSDRCGAGIASAGLEPGQRDLAELDQREAPGEQDQTGSRRCGPPGLAGTPQQGRHGQGGCHYQGRYHRQQIAVHEVAVTEEQRKREHAAK